MPAELKNELDPISDLPHVHESYKVNMTPLVKGQKLNLTPLFYFISQTTSVIVPDTVFPTPLPEKVHFPAQN